MSYWPRQLENKYGDTSGHQGTLVDGRKPATPTCCTDNQELSARVWSHHAGKKKPRVHGILQTPVLDPLTISGAVMPSTAVSITMEVKSSIEI